MLILFLYIRIKRFRKAIRLKFRGGKSFKNYIEDFNKDGKLAAFIAIYLFFSVTLGQMRIQYLKDASGVRIEFGSSCVFGSLISKTADGILFSDDSGSIHFISFSGVFR